MVVLEEKTRFKTYFGKKTWKTAGWMRFMSAQSRIGGPFILAIWRLFHQLTGVLQSFRNFEGLCLDRRFRNFSKAAQPAILMLIGGYVFVNKLNCTIISIGSLRVLEVQESYKNSHYLEYA